MVVANIRCKNFQMPFFYTVTTPSWHTQNDEHTAVTCIKRHDLEILSCLLPSWELFQQLRFHTKNAQRMRYCHHCYAPVHEITHYPLEPITAQLWGMGTLHITLQDFRAKQWWNSRGQASVNTKRRLLKLVAKTHLRTFTPESRETEQERLKTS